MVGGAAVERAASGEGDTRAMGPSPKAGRPGVGGAGRLPAARAAAVAPALEARDASGYERTVLPMPRSRGSLDCTPALP